MFSTQTIVTGSSSYTIHLENDQQVYPCRCGEIHRGEYAIYEYGHHACFHDSLLLLIADDQAICPDCGKSFGWEDKRP